MALTREQHLQRAKIGFGIAAVLAVFLIVWIHLTSKASGGSNTLRSAYVAASGFGCQNRMVYDSFVSDYNSGDHRVAIKRLRSAIDGGECIALSPGEAIYLDQAAATQNAGYERVRPTGSKLEYWTTAHVRIAGP